MQNSEFIGIAFWQTFIKWQKNCNRALKKHNISQTQFTLLYVIKQHQDEDFGTSQMNIADSAGIDKMTASKVLRSLEQDGFILRKDHPTDTRSKLIELTKTGIKKLEQTKITFKEFDSDFFSNLKNEKKFKKALSDLNKANKE